MDIIFLLLGIIIGLVCGYIYLKLTSENSTQALLGAQKSLETKNYHLEDLLKKAQAELSVERTKNMNLTAELSRSGARLEHLNEKLLTQKTSLDGLQQRFSKEFENLANKILEEKTDKFTRINRTSLDEILNPLKEKIKDFEKKIEENTRESIERHSSLKEHLFQLGQANQQISKEANNLASALKGQVKVQGKWGEVILERILEKSGLTKDREYFIQTTINQSRPDILIQLPERKKIIVDSKVSLTAYDRFCSCEDEALKPKFLKEHIHSVRAHIKSLGEKEYQNLIHDGLDFILLFVPVEPAFNLAVLHDAEIFNEAFDKNIVIVSTSTLLATLRTIASIWKQEYQTRNVLEIAQQSGELYDKFVGFIADMDELGRKLNGLQNSYENATNKLYTGKGSLVSKAEKIKKLGAKTTKSIPSDLTNK